MLSPTSAATSLGSQAASGAFTASGSRCTSQTGTVQSVCIPYRPDHCASCPGVRPEWSKFRSTCTSYLRRSHPTALNSTQPPVSPLSSTSRWSPSTTSSPGRSQESLVPSSALRFALVRGRLLLDPTLAPTTAVSLAPPSAANDRERMLFPRRSHLQKKNA